MATRTVGPGGLLGIPTWVVVCLGLPFLLGGIFVQLPKSGPPATPIKKILGLLMFISASAPIWWFMLCSSLPLFIRLFFCRAVYPHGPSGYLELLALAQGKSGNRQASTADWRERHIRAS
jgi:hypothetical protein